MASSAKSRRMWTKDEDETLRRIAEAQALTCNGSVKDWCSISKVLPGRSNKDCRKRFSKVVKSVNKGTWSPDEDRRLIAAMEECGPSWQLVAEKVGTRHAEQCAKRWQHSLDPSIDRSEWTQQENQLLIEAVGDFGRSWRSICKTHFPSRSTTDIKNHYEYLIRHMRNSSRTSPFTQDQSLSIPTSCEESSEASEEALSPQSTSSYSNPSVYGRTEHILTGCHPDPNTYANFDVQHVGSQLMSPFSPSVTMAHYQAQNLNFITSPQTHLPTSGHHLITPMGFAQPSHVLPLTSEAPLPSNLAVNTSFQATSMGGNFMGSMAMSPLSASMATSAPSQASAATNMTYPQDAEIAFHSHHPQQTYHSNTI